jgi:hypothetical protein
MRRLGAIVLIIAAVAVPSAAASRHATAPQLPTLRVNYTMNCTFSIVDDFGKPVTAIAPGAYQVEVTTPLQFKLVDPTDRPPSDFTGCKGWVQFQLTGPGVNLQTTLDTGCDSFYMLPASNFQPGATYTAQDNNQPAATRTVFSTLTSGTPVIPPSPLGSGKGTSSSGSLVGSALHKTRATLAGTVGANGAATLLVKGKPVSTLKPGRYRFTIVDRNPKAGFALLGAKGAKTTLTGAAFVGKRSAIVALSAGRWTYAPGKSLEVKA